MTPAERGKIIRYWEVRRIVFNALLLASIVFSWFIASALIEGVDELPAIRLTDTGVLPGLLATFCLHNLLFSLGYVAEFFCLGGSTKRTWPSPLRPIMVMAITVYCMADAGDRCSKLVNVIAYEIPSRSSIAGSLPGVWIPDLKLSGFPSAWMNDETKLVIRGNGSCEAHHLGRGAFADNHPDRDDKKLWPVVIGSWHPRPGAQEWLVVFRWRFDGKSVERTASVIGTESETRLLFALGEPSPFPRLLLRRSSGAENP